MGNGRDAASLVNADDPNVIEIWNLVFIQYNRVDANTLSVLPAQHVDTGMGLERLVSILQDKSSNYDIDCFAPLLSKVSDSARCVSAYQGRVGANDVDHVDTAYRAIVDHARTLAFALADGAVPNNEGRGYVLRRILRRAARYGRQVLQAPPGLVSHLLPVVVDTFGSAYPELVAAQHQMVEIVREEEAAFETMLERGIKFFGELQDELQTKDQTQVSGDQAFFLYDTLGFPIDLTEQMATEAGLTVDTDGFVESMALQKQRSRTAQRASRNGNAANAVVLELVAEQTAALEAMGVHSTDEGFKYKWDVELPATVMAIYTSRGFLATGESATTDDQVGLVLDKSSFYAEGGGQETDTGTIEFVDAQGAVTGVFAVTDVQVYGGFVLHKGMVEQGSLTVGTHVNCKVDYDRRRLVAPNHSMTHVLNAALRQVLGPGVEQRGSLCNEEKLRFDFSHKKALSVSELQQVEEICQSVVAQGQPVQSAMMALDAARQIEGVRAVFGEVYPDPVRVIRIGDDTSVEFCGGTHIDNTNEAEAFVLVEETAVAKGIRRISAVTKQAAVEALENGSNFLHRVQAAETLDPESTVDLDKQAGAMRKDLDAAFISAALKSELRGRIEVIQKKASEASKRAVQQRVGAVVQRLKQVVHDSLAANEPFLVWNVDIGADAKASQTIINAVKDLAPDMAFLGVSEEVPGTGGKVLAFAVVPDAVTTSSGLEAQEWVLAALQGCNGRGGGRSGTAQAQAPSCNDVSEVYSAAKLFASSKIETTVS
jgi:alanyl-tRNA synthetase